jgi:hypothetical protein
MARFTVWVDVAALLIACFFHAGRLGDMPKFHILAKLSFACQIVHGHKQHCVALVRCNNAKENSAKLALHRAQFRKTTITVCILHIGKSATGLL